MGMASVGSWSFRRKRTMQRVRMGKSIALIGFVAASLLLCSTQAFQPAPNLYRAKPEDVPPWAEQGNFRFTRLEGRANLVGRQVQRRREERAEPHLRPRFRANARLTQAGGVQLDMGHLEQRLVV